MLQSHFLKYFQDAPTATTGLQLLIACLRTYTQRLMNMQVNSIVFSQKTLMRAKHVFTCVLCTQSKVILNKEK